MIYNYNCKKTVQGSLDINSLYKQQLNIDTIPKYTTYLVTPT